MMVETFKDFVLQDRVYAYKELTTNRLFRGAGEIKIKLQSLSYAESLEIGSVAMVGTEAYFIDGFVKYKDLEKKQIYEANGIHVNSILERRTLIAPYTVTSSQTYEHHILQLLNQNIIAPADNNRKISNFEFEATGFLDKPTVDYVMEKMSLAEAINTICGNADLGYRIDYDVDQQKYIFRLIKGKDRTSEVIFSEDFGNVSGSEF